MDFKSSGEFPCVHYKALPGRVSFLLVSIHLKSLPIFKSPFLFSYIYCPRPQNTLDLEENHQYLVHIPELTENSLSLS